LIKVKVKLFATLRKYLPDYDPTRGIDVEVKEGITIHELIEILGLPQDEARVIFVNGVSKKKTEILNKLEEISIFTPVSGG